jgi:hypothetical protein
LVNGDILGRKAAECDLTQRRRIAADTICRQAHVQACSAMAEATQKPDPSGVL